MNEEWIPEEKKRMGRNIFKYYEWEEKKSLIEEIKVWTWTEVAVDIALIKSAFEKLYKTDYKNLGITDDAMVVEKFTDIKVRLIEGDYKNIKVTTPEDIVIAKAFLDAGNFL